MYYEVFSFSEIIHNSNLYKKFHYAFLTFHKGLISVNTSNPSAILFQYLILSAQVEKYCVQTKKKKIRVNNWNLYSC